MVETLPQILFLCTGNSCRSIIAEMLLNHLGKGQYQACSAGSFPTGKVYPKSKETLKRHGIDPGEPRNKSWDEFSDTNFDLIVTVCDQAAGETCPLYSDGPRKLHWSIPDPAQATGTEEEINAVFDQTFHLLKTRIEQEPLP